MAFFKRHPKGTAFKVLPEHFPTATRNLLTLEQMQRLGVLVLGYRGEDTVNVGLLDLTRREHLKEVETLVKHALGSRDIAVRFYRVSQEDFDGVLRVIYGVSSRSQHHDRT